MWTHPRLQPFATVIRRAEDTVQVSLGPGTGIVLSGLSPGEVGLFAVLDGRLDIGALRSSAARSGCPPNRTDELLATLRRHGLLVEGPDSRAAVARPQPLGPSTGDPASVPSGRCGDEALSPDHAPGDVPLHTTGNSPPARRGRSRRSVPGQPPGVRRGDADLAPDAASASAAYLAEGDGLAVVGARATRTVLVDGSGHLVDLIAQTLRQGGIGGVHAGSGVSGWWAMDSTETGILPDLVILVAAGAVSVGSGDIWQRKSIPHLPVVASGHRLSVGPLIVSGGPCLRCLDFHRSERDPAWPAVLAQLSHSLLGDVPPVETDSVLTPMAAGLVGQFTHSLLDGIRPPPLGVSVEVTFGDLRMIARRWVRHPRCECRRTRETMAS